MTCATLKRGIVNIKLYFPNRDKKSGVKFITNCNVLEGIINLEYDKYDAIIITKSSKDRLSLESYLRRTNLTTPYGGSEVNPIIGVINLPHETYKLRKEYNVKDFSELALNYSDDCINKLAYDTVNYINDNYGENSEFTWDTEESNIMPY